MGNNEIGKSGVKKGKTN